MGIPRLQELRCHPLLSAYSSVWPFETGFVERPGWGRKTWILHAEIWPGLVNNKTDQLCIANPGWVKDQAQVIAMCEWAVADDLAGDLASRFRKPAGLTEPQLRGCVNEEGWILGTPEPQGV
jgi:hypothetical protein